MKNLLNVDTRKLSFLRFSESAGGAPSFKESDFSRKSLLARIEWVAGMFTEEGRYDFPHKDIEEYAICLDHDGQKDEAYLILSHIVDGRDKDILYVSHDARYPFSPLSARPGMLGYESLYIYAELSLERNEETAIAMLAEIVNKIPTECYPIRVADVRVDALVWLTEIKKKGEHDDIIGRYIGIDLEKELAAAKWHQY